MGKKISFPMGDGKVANGYYNPTSIPAKIQAKKNATATATRERLAAQGFQAKQITTRATEPVQSEAFKNGYCNCK
tara:strand:- start:2051 stop:2275 length:225 start_codon:yes stop_codon:yes gene_type:complete